MSETTALFILYDRGTESLMVVVNYHVGRVQVTISS